MTYDSLLDEGPKSVVTFCSGCTMAASADGANDEENSAAFQGFTMILEGLADLIACRGNSLQVGCIKETSFLIYS